VTAPDERVWLKHTEHGGYFHCPADAVGEWAAMGWEPTDAPPEENPVVAEMLAAQQAAAEQAAADEKAAKAATRASRKSGADDVTKE
jgi:hypothetical protein